MLVAQEVREKIQKIGIEHLVVSKLDDYSVVVNK